MKQQIPDSPRRVALIGFGALGQAIAAELSADRLAGVVLAGALVLPGHAHEGLACAWETMDELLDSEPDLVIEAAGHAALSIHATRCLLAGHDLVVASVGALMDEPLRHRLLEAARQGRSRLVVPSGALGGLDYLRAARRLGPVNVSYVGRKPVKAWRGTAAEGMVDLDKVTEAATFFRGAATEAATLFPQNANVVAALALAVDDPKSVSVELVADPRATHNSHEVQAEGAAGSIHLGVRNEPMAGNPKTSRITAFSLLEVVAARLGQGLC
ncbi:aspartate dehydrogenase [Variovorax paradoxus]|uniref:aspartate dehydrogenase n=1 Tax=Variovorax paradoxus TaxID=34073 RepID=UPI0027857CF9|nr:aspartate dehydrogenase [Variovorax paradoxus]MDP9932800.1 aspartate dehydrogenase [Variovorax paradoxus]